MPNPPGPVPKRDLSGTWVGPGTVDDPKFYTKPWAFMRANLYWMKAQEFAETLCIPSEALEYRDTLAKPSGIEIVP